MGRNKETQRDWGGISLKYKREYSSATTRRWEKAEKIMRQEQDYRLGSSILGQYGSGSRDWWPKIAKFYKWKINLYFISKIQIFIPWIYKERPRYRRSFRISKEYIHLEL
jgi:hypothetical protein